MAIYRKIDCRISNDKKFRELSVEGKLAWYTILSRRDLAPIGAFKASFESLAIEQRGNEYLNEGLQKDLPKGFSEVFIQALNELLSKGLIKYDSESFLIYVPNFLKYNFPENPNVVKSWNSALDSLPECDLTNHVLAKSAQIILNSQRDSFIKALPKEFNEAYRKGFAKDLPKGFSKDFGKGMPKQEQEQETYTRTEKSEEHPEVSKSFAGRVCEKETPLKTVPVEQELPLQKTTVSKTEIVEKKTKAKRQKKEKIPCPFKDGDQIPEDYLAIAKRYGVPDPQSLFDSLIAYCKAKDVEYADYKAAFTTFCINDKAKREKKSQNQFNNAPSFEYEPPGGFTEEYYREQCEFDKDGNLIL